MTDYFDEIILDTAAGMGEAFQAAARVSDRALLVLTPDPVALRDGRIAADALLDGGMRTVPNQNPPHNFANKPQTDRKNCFLKNLFFN